MNTTKALAIIFLAVWLILTGISHLFGISIPALGHFIMNLLALTSGVLLLVSLRHCCDSKHK